MGYARFGLVAGAVVALGVGGAAVPAPQAGPKARYWVDVGTSTGFGPGMNAMSMIMGRGGGGGADQHTLTLRLGSTLAPAGGAAHADHFLPAAMNMGPSVPLETPEKVQSTPGPAGPTSEAPENFRQPKGRLLLYWGCGAHVGPGQPVIFDFSKITQGQIPPHLFSVDVPREIGPMESNSRTYGHWPNSQRTKPLTRDASLIGAHRVSGNYSPDINFTLAQDFMPGVHVQSASQADGSSDLSWNSVMNATGYYATLMGANRGGGEATDVVMWSSAGRQEFGGGLSDYLAPATVARLIGQKVVMPPTQTHCTVPAEVQQAAPMSMIQLIAYGPYVDVTYPPRPANPRTPWSPEWTVHVRYRSSTMVLPGMGGMGRHSGDDTPADPDNPPPKKKCRPGLGGLLGRLAC